MSENIKKLREKWIQLYAEAKNEREKAIAKLKIENLTKNIGDAVHFSADKTNVLISENGTNGLEQPQIANAEQNTVLEGKNATESNDDGENGYFEQMSLAELQKQEKMFVNLLNRVNDENVKSTLLLIQNLIERKSPKPEPVEIEVVIVEEKPVIVDEPENIKKWLCSFKCNPECARNMEFNRRTEILNFACGIRFSANEIQNYAGSHPFTRFEMDLMKQFPGMKLTAFEPLPVNQPNFLAGSICEMTDN